MAFVHQARCRAGLFNELAMTRKKNTVTPIELWRPTQCNNRKCCHTCDCGAGRQKVPLLGSKCVPKLSSWLCDRRQCSMGRKGFSITPVLRRTLHSVWDRVAVPTAVSSTDKCPSYETQCIISAYGIDRNEAAKFNNFGVTVFPISTFLKIHLTMRCSKNPVVLHHDISQKSGLWNKLQ